MSVSDESPLRDRMIFNVGSRRSGTYWLQRIVTAHPSVGSVPSETHLMSHGVAPLMDRFQHDDPQSPAVGRVYGDRDEIVDVVRRLCDIVFGQFLEAGQERVAERTPLHALHLPLIAEIYPDAQFVHIIRDGRDVTRSIAAQQWGPGSVGEAAIEWREAVEAARSAAIPADRYREVRYEALLEDSASEIERLYRWLRLPTSPEALAYPLTESRLQRNVDEHGVRGVAAGKWRRAFSAGDLEDFNREAGDLLERLGYPAERPRAGRLRRSLGAIGARTRRQS